VQEELAKMLDGTDEFGKYVADEAERRIGRSELKKQADELLQSNIFSDRIEGTRLRLQVCCCCCCCCCCSSPLILFSTPAAAAHLLSSYFISSHPISPRASTAYQFL
jgi:hypothetical protein